ncbi:MAG: TldD/PmbA family protein [Oligoflexia bacterium]|nr:TldD/PmbA family protein [Oligoflexia bacterium]
MAQDLSTFSSVLIDESLRLEPCFAEVCADESTEMRIVYEASDFSVATTNSTTLFGLRTILNQRLGFVTTNSLNLAELKKSAQEAQNIARLSPESPFHSIAKKGSEGASFFEVYDTELANLAPKELLRYAELLVHEAKKDERVAIDRAEISLNLSTRIIHNSNGVFQRVRQATCNWFIMGMAKSGDEVTSFDYDGNAATSLNKLESKIQRSIEEFRNSVLGSLGARHGKSYKGQVLLHPSAVSQLLLGCVGFNVSARAQQDGMSKWKDLINTEVAHRNLTVKESPTASSRVHGWMPFDREGVMTTNNDVIKSGALNFTAHSLFTAKRAQVNPTGNAMGSSRALPSIGLTNLEVCPGTASDSELYQAVKEGLVLKRFSGNADPVSGQFSGIAKNSWWIENGQRAYPVKEVMVSGNMFDLLKEITAIGRVQHEPMGSVLAPYIAVDKVNVTA